MTPAAPASDQGATPWLRRAFFFAVLAFVWWRFSENTADNDLWGHVLYGQRMLHLHGLETTETLSWTAAGQPWINHEVLAEVALGLAHRLGGSSGLWSLMIILAAVTLGLAWQAGAGADRNRRLVALGLLALSTNFIAIGYSVRPQLFTFFFFVLLLLGLRHLFAGRTRPWAFLLPLLLVVWTNTHGGFLAGWLVLLVAVTAEGLGRFLPAGLRRVRCEPFGGDPLVLANVAAAGTLALVANPWGWKLVAWTVETIRLPRPNIYEWQPMPLTLASAPFFFVMLFGAPAWGLSRQPRRLWEMLVWVMLAAMTIQHQRHAPLFGLASLVLLPVHLQDLLARLTTQTESLRATARRPVIAVLGALALLIAGTWCLQINRSISRQYPFHMEVPRSLFPVSAIDYMKAHQLTGNTLTFFDWGQQMLWELPDNPVSFDGRLDTVYPPEVMDAHWRLYAGQDPGPALPVNLAKYALLPSSSRAVDMLLFQGWTLVYYDPLAAVLVRESPANLKIPEPVTGGRAAILGSAPFPDAPPVLAARASAVTRP
jgi:hypothetical protein